MFKLKRVYEEASPDDGARVLVDRLWPRGVSKERARLDAWMKEIAPSTELRKWFAHDPEKWRDFQQKYRRELRAHRDLIDELRRLERERGTLTLLYGAKDEGRNEAVVLMRLLSR
ncbi:MAG TPA: DUF488 family protein [Dehalococcoidia bacterium]|jgi:uncharacterized protein YeaO (DUF488 family)|nr:DUF488 family protein [Dehalococcoidia bacterium]